MPWEGPQWWTPISHHRGGGPSSFALRALRTAAARLAVHCSPPRVQVVNLCTCGGTEEYCLLVRLSLRIRNTDRYHPVASSPPSAHHDLSWSWGGGFHGTRRLVARPGGADRSARGSPCAPHASHGSGASQQHMWIVRYSHTSDNLLLRSIIGLGFGL